MAAVGTLAATTTIGKDYGDQKGAEEMRPIRTIIGLLVGLGVVVSTGFAPPSAIAEGGKRCFPETGHCISGAIRTYWEANGGLPVFGYPLSDLIIQKNADGWRGPSQWFERDRLEDHGTAGVMAGRLGADVLFLQGRPWEQLPKAGRAASGCRYFPETGHSLCPPFLDYWQQRGGLARFGLPISEVMNERNPSGWEGPTQWFERRRMEHHGGENVMLGLLGTALYSGNIGSTPPASPRPNRKVRDAIQGIVWLPDKFYCASGPPQIRYDFDGGRVHFSGDAPSMFGGAPLRVLHEDDIHITVAYGETEDTLTVIRARKFLHIERDEVWPDGHREHQSGDLNAEVNCTND
jgi:hypothetical protein